MPLITQKVPQKWEDLEELVRDILTECGMKADRQVTRPLPRGTVDVDVVAVEQIDGIESLIICECKNWKSRVPKEIVHSFRTVMQEVGANVGYIISREGFQSGALHAAEATNIRLVTFDEFQQLHFVKWYRLRRVALETEIRHFHAYYEPIGPAGYNLLTTDEERAEYDAVWDRYVYVSRVLLLLSPYFNRPPPSLPLDRSNPLFDGIVFPDEVLSISGYRELFEFIANVVRFAMPELRSVNPVTRGRQPAEIDSDRHR